MYHPPNTDAQVVNVVNGTVRPISPDQTQALILFSTDEDVAHLSSMLKEIPGVLNFELWDGQGIVCPPIQYGQDGRKVNCYRFDYQLDPSSPALKVEDNFGILIAQKCYGSAWNWGRQAPYTKLFVDQTPVATQINWGH